MNMVLVLTSVRDISALPFQRHHLGADRFGAGTYRRRRFSTGRFGAARSTGRWQSVTTSTSSVCLICKLVPLTVKVFTPLILCVKYAYVGLCLIRCCSFVDCHCHCHRSWSAACSTSAETSGAITASTDMSQHREVPAPKRYAPRRWRRNGGAEMSCSVRFTFQWIDGWMDEWIKWVEWIIWCV